MVESRRQAGGRSGGLQGGQRVRHDICKNFGNRHDTGEGGSTSARQCVRVNKEMDSKSIGPCPQEFESPRCRSCSAVNIAWGKRLCWRRSSMEGCRRCERHLAAWCSGMILALGARGPSESPQVLAGGVVVLSDYRGNDSAFLTCGILWGLPRPLVDATARCTSRPQTQECRVLAGW
jgi:hypothetical protein